MRRTVGSLARCRPRLRCAPVAAQDFQPRINRLLQRCELAPVEQRPLPPMGGAHGLWRCAARPGIRNDVRSSISTCASSCRASATISLASRAIWCLAMRAW